ncbi:MAG TPA: hypothetical protein VN641_15125 [Urbifossiella sp.]|nr:hypothetical protein [Urbifossiella sp.]
MLRQLLKAAVMLVAFSASSRGDEPALTGKAGLDRMKKLAGTWVEADKDGKPTAKVVSVIKVTAAGSTVHETIFPGQPQEMVSVYHLDKGDLVMTHYCSLGNQPRMKADPASPKNSIRFAFAGGTNFDPNKDMHMHEATLTFVDDDHIELAGVAWVDGKPAENHCGQMKLVRKK